jgi:integrin beta 3
MISKHIEMVMPEIITRASLLVPPGRDGLPGRPGTVGDAGRDGVSIDNIELKQLDKRTHALVVKTTDGGVFSHPIRTETLLDAGVHKRGASYEKGDGVTHGGSYWIAIADTSETPGASNAWRLAVKRGRDGKDAE